MSVKLQVWVLVGMPALLFGSPLRVTAAVSPSDHVVAYWQAVFRSDYEAAYDLYARRERTACAPADASEAVRRQAFCKQVGGHAKAARLTEVGVGATEVPAGETLQTAENAVVLSAVKAELTGEAWRHARVRTEQSSHYWLFTRTSDGWEPTRLLKPDRVADALRGTRKKLGPARLLRAGDDGPIAIAVADVAVLPDNKKEIEDEHERIEREEIVRRATISWLEFAAVVLAGLTLLVAWIVRCNRRARQVTGDGDPEGDVC